MASTSEKINISDSDSDYDYKKNFASNRPDMDTSHIGLVLNRCYGEFELSDWAKDKLGITNKDCCDIDRFNPALVKLVDDYNSKKVSGPRSNLIVKYIPTGYYQGKETGNSLNKKYYRIVNYYGIVTIELNKSQYNSYQFQKTSN